MSRREVLAVKIITLLRRGKARILADGPGAVGIHGRAHPARERRKAGHLGSRRLWRVIRRVDRFNFYPFGGLCRQLSQRFSAQFFDRKLGPIFEGEVFHASLRLHSQIP